MKLFFGILTIYLLITFFFVGVGLGIGFLLHWLVPAVDIGIGALIGVVATGLSIYFIARLTALLDVHDETDADVVPGTPPEVIISPLVSFPTRRRRKRKPS